MSTMILLSLCRVSWSPKPKNNRRSRSEEVIHEEKDEAKVIIDDPLNNTISITCSDCGDEFKNKRSLFLHKKKHIGELHKVTTTENASKEASDVKENAKKRIVSASDKSNDLGRN